MGGGLLEGIKVFVNGSDIAASDWSGEALGDAYSVNIMKRPAE